MIFRSDTSRYCENSPDAFDFGTFSTSLAGLGIGLLATAAVSLVSSGAELPLAGAQVVRQAFRLGVLVDEVSQNLQPRDSIDTGTPDTWAYVLPDVAVDEVQEELNAIHAKEVSWNPCCRSITNLTGAPENPRSQQGLHQCTQRDLGDC